MKAHATIQHEKERGSPLQEYRLLKAQARRFAQNFKQDLTRLSNARAFCTQILSSYWQVLCIEHEANLELQPHRLPLAAIEAEGHRLASQIGTVVASFPTEDSGYLIGSIYTVMLPESMRSEMGAYYTPPPMVKRLLDLAEQAGADFSSCTAIDPACGGGAFLAPLALRMLKSTKKKRPEEILSDLSTRLKGIELDPFAAWVTQVLLEASLLPLCKQSQKRFPQVITVGDALQFDEIGQFDLVIGNPPYGRVKLDEPMRKKYARSLYGHSNLYGLFTDLALRLVNESGVIAYLTPTSFLGGQYFKALRKLLTEQSSPCAFDFIADREGVFDDVLQETILVSYRKGKTGKDAKVSLLVPQGLEQALIESVGKVKIPLDGSSWIIPRSSKDGDYVSSLSRMTTRLVDLGYKVSTGQLVWNRHKTQLRQNKINGALPIVWSESITKTGFSYSAERKNHAPFIELHSKQEHLITKQSCVLLQRTSAKEQDRRLLCAVIPQKFIDSHHGVVIENHLNMVYSDKETSVSPEALAFVLNSEAVDRAFRCISGSVAVSAYELEALPLPSIEQIKTVQDLLKIGAAKATIESTISSFYSE